MHSLNQPTASFGGSGLSDRSPQPWRMRSLRHSADRPRRRGQGRCRMPPIFLHMALARDISGQLHADALESEHGAYLLGATTPDIRVLTRGNRQDTHFFDLENYEHQDSVEEFFNTHSHLSQPERLDTQAIAFVCGYATHLVLDEQYIVSMYRPYFGQLSALGGGLQADTMDRVLQYELERRRREQTSEVEEIRNALCDCSLALDVGFLDSETLKRWQAV